MSDRDEFDELVFLEDRFYRPALQEGQDMGVNAGNDEGYALGWEKGTELAAEIGYYMGCATMWLTLVHADPENVPERAEKSLTALQAAIDSFANDPLRTDLQASVAHIRAKFRQCTALLRVQQRYNADVTPGPAANLAF